MREAAAREQAKKEKLEEDKFMFLKRKQTFKFQKFRTEGRDLSDSEIKKGKFETLKLPKRGRYRGPRLLAGRWKGGRFTWDPDDIGYHGNADQAKLARQTLQRRLKFHKFHLERTLGWGGNGIASLYRFKSGPDSPVDRFVVKFPVHHRESVVSALKRERRRQAVYRGALHIVQTRDIVPAQGRNPASFHDMMFLEYLWRGSLHKIICSAAQNEEPFPNRLLWHMFHCLVKSCVAMEYPPSKDDGRDCDRDPAGGIVGEVSERIPPDLQVLYDQAVEDGTWKDRGNAPGGEGLVHFDIDPQNILFGGCPAGPLDDPHDDFPVVKVGDFGNAWKIDADFLRKRSDMWTFRDQAKPNFSTPEQFTAEWDWVKNYPGEEILITEEDADNGILPPAPIEVAGKYSWKTNLYQLALCMISAITFHLPSLPPFPGQIEIIDPRDGVRKTVWSYGAYILEPKYKRVDWKLRHLVAWCLCEKPAHRPNMKELLQKVDDYLETKEWGKKDSDEVVNEWIDVNVDVPPPPPKRKHWIDEPVGAGPMPWV
ncbi:kinase-like domain-containing protein [Chaetomium sp. MPI-CAGE-AT-0009]|nr:kinase-like domain-containing protein [Chaetomium sp. MPI-CAGE-AT-0009]